MTASLDTDSLWVNHITELLNGLQGQISTVFNISFSDMSKKGVQEIFTEADGASVVDHEEAIPLQKQKVSLGQEHVLRRAGERPSMNKSHHGQLAFGILGIRITVHTQEVAFSTVVEGNELLFDALNFAFHIGM